VFGPELRTWLLSLESTRVVGLIRALLLAEAGRCDAPAGSVSMPGNVYRPDGGVDGHSDLPVIALPPFPVGRWSWQVKATEDIDLTTELHKPAVLEDLADGRDYLVIASREWTAGIRRERATALAEAVAGIAPGRTGMLMSVEDIERMLLIYPAVPSQFGGPAPLGLSLERWAGTLETNLYPFVSDARRTQLVESIRSFATETMSSAHLHVFGDSGVGKSRAVFEALNGPTIVERVVAHLEYSDDARRAVLAAAQSETAHVIIVVDEVESYQVEQLANAASIAGSRIRLITIGDRFNRHGHGDAANIEVVPLEEGIVTSLVERVTGLSEEDARLVAGLTEGFPKLAILLAEAVAASADRLSITALLRSRKINELLHRMIVDEDTRRDLAYLALVSRIGFEADLAVETSQLCQAFELDRIHFRATVDEETNRFVATAGRYRRVSPGALAMWLAQELIRSAPDAFVRHVTALPSPLFEAFSTQLQMLGGDQPFDAVIEEVVARRARTFRSLTQLSRSDASFLKAVAFASPEVAAPVIRSAVLSTPLEEVRTFADDRRRAFVWALQHLLWFKTTFEDAATSLLALAVAENETWANNATGILADAFQVMLGGTEVPLPQRLSWLEAHTEDFGQDSQRLAVQIASAALRAHESRGGGWQGARLQPIEWRPETTEEAIALHVRALEFLVAMARLNPHLSDLVAGVLSDALWLMLRVGEVDAFVAAGRAVQWSTQARSNLAAKLVKHLRIDDQLDVATRAKLEGLVEHLHGSSPLTRLESLLAVEVWDLERGTAGADSPDLVAVADQIATEGPQELTETVLAVPERKASTTLALFQVLGQRHPELAVLAGSEQLPAEARVGYVAGLAASAWPAAETVIEKWLGIDDDRRFLPWLVAMLPASPRLAEVAVVAVTSGSAPLSELNRLRYGRWSSPLPVTSIALIVDAYIADSPTGSDLECAIGLMDSWLDDHPDSAAELLKPGTRLMELAAAATASDAMLEFSRNRIADRLKISVEARLPATMEAIKASGRVEGHDLVALANMAHREPEVVVPAVLGYVLEPDFRRMSLESAHLVSVMSNAAGLEIVIDYVLGRPREDQIRALRHLDLSGPQLDPVMVALLERWGDDGDFFSQAVARFIFPGEVVRGPYSQRLQERRKQAAEIATSHPSPAVRHWAQETVRALDEFIEGQLQREAERDL
jgi:hypothetical protein